MILTNGLNNEDQLMKMLLNYIYQIQNLIF
jgi:hypothetical protein